MKTFKDLEFKKHLNSMFNTQSTMQFNNDYGVSVITGDGAYSSNSGPYEVAITYKGGLTYNTNITNDVLGYQTEKNVTEIMIKVQKLK